MKTFDTILKMSQMGLKAYLTEYLQEESYTPIVGDGFIYAKGEIPIIVTAHLDRHPIHKELVQDISVETITENQVRKTRLTSPQGICGDDRCGVFMIMNLIKNHKVSVLFFEDEEIECVGSKKFVKTEWIHELRDDYFIIELDRSGQTDAVFYSCHNEAFIDWILKETGYTKCEGLYSDISEIMPAANLAGVNLSCGYYNAHSAEEYIIYEEMMHTLDVVKTLLHSLSLQKWDFIN